MRVIPIKMIRKLIDEFQYICHRPGVSVQMKLTGSMVLTKNNELQLAATAETDLEAIAIEVLPVDVAVSTGWHRDAQSEGSLSYEITITSK